MEIEQLKHPNLPASAGHGYVQENVGRALSDLLDQTKPWRERILKACDDAHRPNDNEFYTCYMSDETLEAWRDCTPTRFGKPVANLDEADLAKIASSLCSFILLATRDHGIFLSGQDPHEFNRLGRVLQNDNDYQAPIRNMAERVMP